MRQRNIIKKMNYSNIQLRLKSLDSVSAHKKQQKNLLNLINDQAQSYFFGNQKYDWFSSTSNATQKQNPGQCIQDCLYQKILMDEEPSQDKIESQDHSDCPQQVLYCLICDSYPQYENPYQVMLKELSRGMNSSCLFMETSSFPSN